MAHADLARRRGRLLPPERLRQRAPHPLQLRGRQRQRTLQLERQPPQLERRLAERAQLLAQQALVQRMRDRRLQRHGALHPRAAAQIVEGFDLQRHAHRAAHGERHGDFPLARRDPFHLPRQLGILRLPDHVADLHQPQIERPLIGAAEDELEQSGLDFVAGVQSPAGLFVFRLPLIEEHPVAGLQLRRIRLGADQHVPCARVDLLDPPHQHPAVAGIEAVHQLLVVGTAQKAVRERA